RVSDTRRPRAARPLESARDLNARVGLKQRLRLVEDLVGDLLPLTELGVERLFGRALQEGGGGGPASASRAAATSASSDSAVRRTGTRIVRYSTSSPSTIAGARTVWRNGSCKLLRYSTWS